MDPASPQGVRPIVSVSREPARHIIGCYPALLPSMFAASEVSGGPGGDHLLLRVVDFRDGLVSSCIASVFSGPVSIRSDSECSRFLT